MESLGAEQALQDGERCEAMSDEVTRSGTIADRLLWIVAIIACPFAVLMMPGEGDDGMDEQEVRL